MKYLVLTLLLGSCAHSKYPIYREPEPAKKLNHIDRKYKCVFRLVEQNGTKAIDAEKVCSGILRNR